MSEPADQRREASDTLPDRRRPQRAEFHNPHLLALLRQTGQILPDSSDTIDKSECNRAIEAEAPDRAQTDLGPAFGIAVSAVIGIVIWLACAVAALAVISP